MISPLSPLCHVSDQHPYAMFIAGGLRSPSLAKAWVDVGDNANAYLASADIDSLLGQIKLSPPNSGSWVHSWNGVCEE